MPVYSQRVIELKEVKVFPENFSHELIERMKIAVKKNYKKNISNYSIDIESMKNDTDTIAHIKQESMIQIDALKTRKYKILKSNGKVFFQEDFFKIYDQSRLFKYGLLEGRLNVLLDISEYSFFNNFNDYSYQVFDMINFYEISFSSTDKFGGKVKIAKESANILELDFENLSDVTYVNSGRTIGATSKTKYMNEIINIRQSIDQAHLYFSESKNKKMLLNKISSSVKLAQYEVVIYDLNKTNKILSKDSMSLITNLKLEKIESQ
jgi:hypothetical protein